jgi:CRP/FNR family cyclic AMP-dependent transcriptional regulator
MAALDEIAELRSVPMFAGLSDEVLGHLAARASVFDAGSGHVLVQPNQPGNGLLILTAGTADVELGSTTVQCGAGDCIGELSLLVEGLVHVARVRATSDVRGLAISRGDFDELLESDPQIAVGLLRELAARLVETDRMLAGAG